MQLFPKTRASLHTFAFVCLLLLVSSASAIQHQKLNPPPRGTAIWFVNGLQTNIGDGITWETAFADLQSALDVATYGDQIWVATGRYLPSNTGGSSDNRDATFTLIDGVGIYGGFLGDEVNLDQRNPSVNLTILSGDLQEDDQNSGNILDNARHVVTASGVLSASCVLDGFVISAGNADGNQGGGGMFVSALPGPELRRCLFTNNTSSTYGGAIYLSENASLNVYSSRIELNSANIGGGLYNAGTLAISNSLVSSNQATSRVGALISQGTSASLNLKNCNVIQNVAEDDTGGIFVESGAFVLANSIVWGNQDLSGDDEFSQILLNDDVAKEQITYSCIQNMNDNLSGSNNISANP